MDYLVRFSALIAMIFAVGCATPKAKFEKEKVQPVKTVAFVGFTSLNQVPDPFEGVAPTPMMGVPTINTFAKMTDFSDKLLKSFMDDLAAEMQWKIKSVDQVFSQDVYKDLYLERMKNWKNMTTPSPAYQLHFAKNVLPLRESDLFTPDVRDHMMEQLKVDALVSAQIKSSIVKPSFAVGGLGIGGEKTKSEIVFKVYKKGQAEGVWMDGHAEGPESKEALSTGWFKWNISQEPKLFSMYGSSTKDATKVLFIRRNEP